MYFYSIDVFIRQFMLPHWRDVKVSDGEGGYIDKPSGKFYFIRSITFPFRSLLNEFKVFRQETNAKINLNAQVMVIEHHIKQITGAVYGVYVTDHLDNQFKVNIPELYVEHKDEIQSFLKKVTPLGRKYSLNFY